MKNMKKMLLVLAAALFLSGCSTNQYQSEVTQTPEKVGDTRKTGVISQVGDSFYITATGGQPEQIETYTVDLSQYVGQTVTVVGQFSGNTLFVGSVE